MLAQYVKSIELALGNENKLEDIYLELVERYNFNSQDWEQLLEIVEANL